MKFDPNAPNPLDWTDWRKSSPIEEVKVLPRPTEWSDIVHMDGSTYAYLREKLGKFEPRSPPAFDEIGNSLRSTCEPIP